MPVSLRFPRRLLTRRFPTIPPAARVSRSPGGRVATLGCTVLGLTVLGLTGGAGIASAHVTVNPNTAVAGSYPLITFRVPNESATAETVALQVDLPMSHPFASVAVKKEPGWTAKVTTSKLATPISDDDNADITQAVSSITWTADASGRIALGQFADFDVSVGPVPRVATLAFTAVQTYSDGTVVRWDQPTPAAGPEPEHPAPVLTITGAGNGAAAGMGAGAGAGAAAGSGEPSGTSAAAVGTPTVSPALTVTVAAQAAAGSGGVADDTARTLGVAGILVGALGLLAAALALRNRVRARP